MAISVAEFTDVNETLIHLTYDDGRSDVDTPKIGRFYDEMIAQPFVPTAFLSVAGRLAEAKLLAEAILETAAGTATDAISAAAGGWTFNCTPRLREDIAFADDGSNATELEDDGGTVRTLTDANVDTLETNWKAARKTHRDTKVSEKVAVNAGLTVAGVDAVLAASSFGVLGPVYT